VGCGGYSHLQKGEDVYDTVAAVIEVQSFDDPPSGRLRPARVNIGSCCAGRRNRVRCRLHGDPLNS
jgi:hypothetical protein